MTKGTFYAMGRATPEKFEFSVKVPETITHDKRLNVDKGSITSLEEFLEKISPLKTANKLGAILIQLPPSFTVKESPTHNSSWIDFQQATNLRSNLDILRGKQRGRGIC